MPTSKVLLGRLSKSKTRMQKLRKRSWKWWFRHYNGFYVKALFWLKRLWCKKFYVLRSRCGLLNLTIALFYISRFWAMLSIPNPNPV